MNTMGLWLSRALCVVAVGSILTTAGLAIAGSDILIFAVAAAVITSALSLAFDREYQNFQTEKAKL